MLEDSGLAAHRDALQQRLLLVLAQGAGLARDDAPAPALGELSEELLDLARDHGVLPWLAELEAQRGPRGAATLAREECARSNLLLARALTQLAPSFNEAGIPMLAMKGPVLATQLYADLAARRSEDLDLLVRPTQMDEAAALLEAHGYERVAVYPKDTQAAFLDRNTQIGVDLHWDLPPPDWACRTEPLWRDRVCVEVLGTQIPTFARDDALIVSAVNAMKHFWRPRLAHFVDLAHGARSLEADDWARLRRRAHQLRAEKILLAALEVTGALFPGALPDWLLNDCRDTNAPDTAAATREVLARLFEPGASRKVGMRNGERAERYYLHLDERPLSQALNALARIARRINR